ncbi:phospholipase D-like domain-containing protein [Paraburkholderia sediminicola]|uniref:phospholipase D-like domain-containing protein n=1 Tax=Paraburkholderia sediminicola TaxID=458836 RepID=UPI0038BBECEA
MAQPNHIVTPLALNQTSGAMICSPWFVQRTDTGRLAEYPPVEATYRPLVNGKEAFGAVYDAILAAKHTVEIICWGFQPSMYFKRGDGESMCIGDLLIKKGQEGVKIRILCWADTLPVSQVSENSTPGMTLLRSLWTQNENNTEREYDRKWYDLARMAASPEQEALNAELQAKMKQAATDSPERPSLTPHPLTNIQLVTRDFSFTNRIEMMWRETFSRSDANLSEKAVILGYGAEPTHHQKMVLVDYEAPEHAVGFVMGHNTLDAYWDDDAHGFARMHPRFGRNGATPRQDMSAIVTGPVLEYLNENFCRAWKRSTNVDLLGPRKALASKLTLRRDRGTATMAQIARTQSQEGQREDIKALYLQTVSNTANFIYIENQYFRWEKLAQTIKGVAKTHADWGRDPGRHGPIYLFVVTNSTDEAIGPGTVSTYRMLESLGRADTLPNVARLERNDVLLEQRDDAQMQLQGAQTAEQYTSTDYGMAAQSSSIAQAHAKALERGKAAQQKLDAIDRQMKDNDDRKKAIVPSAIPGLKIHVCTLVAPDSPADNWVPVYVHSKIMIIDDVFLTHGSANINSRSMEVDSELNICHENAAITQPLRKRLWGIHTRSRAIQRQEDTDIITQNAAGDNSADAFKAWEIIISKNKHQKDARNTPIASLVGFYRESAKRSRLD